MSPAHFLSHARRNHGKLIALLSVAALAVILLVGYQLQRSYQERIRAAETTTRNYAAIFEARLDATLRRIDADLQQLVYTLPAAALSGQAVSHYASELDAVLDSHLVNFPELAGMRVSDVNGDLLYTSARAATPRTNIVDRDYFRRLRDNPSSGLVFSQVVTSRTTGRQSVAVARALRDDQGNFRGIVYAVIDLQYFQKLFQSLDLGAQGSITLRRSDDQTLVVRWPHLPEEVNRPLTPEHPIVKRMAAGEKRSALQFAAQVDAVSRIVSFHALQSYPFYFIVGMSRNDVLAAWRAHALMIGGSIPLLLGLLSVLLFRLSRAQAQQAHALTTLAQSEERARLVLETSMDAVIGMDSKGLVNEWSAGANLIFGHARSEALGRVLSDLIIPPALRDAHNSGLKRFLETGAGAVIGRRTEVTAMRAGGSEFPAELSIAHIRRGGEHFFSAFVRDITGRRRAEHALQSSEANLRAISDNASVGILVTFQGRHVFANRFMEQMLGYTAEELLNTGIGDIIHPDARTEVTERHRRRVAGESVPQQYESVVLRKDGQPVPVEIRGALTHWNGEPAGMVFMSDISDRKRADEALRASEARFHSICDNIQDVYFESTLDGTITEMSPQVRILSQGLAGPEDYIGKASTGFYQDPARREAFVAALKEHGSVTDFEISARRRDGSLVPCSLSAKLLFDENRRPLRIAGTIRDISDRRRAEEALRLSEANLRAVAENATVGISIFQDGSRVFANRRTAEMLGYRLEEFLTLAIGDVIHPDSRNLVLERAFKRAAGEDVPPRYEFKALAKDGRTVPVEGNYAVIAWNGRPAVIAFVVDIAERKRAEEALRESEQRFERVVRHINDALIVDDPEGRLVFANERFFEIFGIATRDLRSVAIEDYVAPEWAGELRDRHLRRMRGEDVPDRFQYQSVRPDGTRIWLDVTVVKVLENGQVIGTQSAIRDITVQIEVEQQRKKLETQLSQANKLEAIGTLAGGIAHDFNNVISAIIGNVELAREDVGADHHALQSLEEIGKASRRARDLVSQILAFSRQQPQPRQAIALAPLIEEVVKLLRATLPAGIELGATLAADAPSVLADPTQIHQVLMNLCTNAWHAMDEGRGSIHIQLDSAVLGKNAVRIHADLQPGRYARLSVKDSGKGMDAITLERIFEPFFTTKAVGEGTGLGLSVVHGIMRGYQGAITVNSRPGSGTTFHLYFPATDAATETAGAEKTPAAPLRGRGQHVLYLDDDDSLVLLVTRMLERGGYRVTGYTESAHALQALRADAARFDLVVTDYNMPGMSGLDVAREVARIRPDLPIVVTSGYITDELREKAPQAGVRQLVYKPNSAEELCETVRRLMDQGN